MNWLAALVFLLVSMLFVSGPDGQDSRIAQEIWDFGHVVLFAALGLLVLRMPRLKDWSWSALAGLFAISAPVLGLLIELLQLWVGRDFAYKDVLADSMGAFCGLAFYFARQLQLPAIFRASLGTFLVVLLVFALKPLGIVLIDHYYMQKEYPVLADFETPFELGRWENHLAELQISNEQVKSGEKSLRITFLPGEYPDVALYDFAADWSGFRSVHFSLFNAQNFPVQLMLKIHDAQHAADGYRSADRFNRALSVNPGWNELVIPLNEVEHAPGGRLMNIGDISNFSLFIKNLDVPVVLYLDGLYLSNN